MTADLVAIRENLMVIPAKEVPARGIILRSDRVVNVVVSVVVNRVGLANQGGRSMDFQSDRDRQPKELHKAICSECKKECEVPFKPREDRPIYCRDCYSKRKNSGR